MRSLRFWKREPKTAGDHPEAPVIGKFGISPRTDVGMPDPSDDPEIATRAAALRKRSESLEHELRVAEAAKDANNQWRRQVALIAEALEAVERERDSLAHIDGTAGAPLPPVPITDTLVSLDPVAAVRFRVADNGFAYAEELDWAERGTQIARSDLHRDEGNVEALVPPDFPPGERAGLIEHLEGSLFTFATELRDRAIEGRGFPNATLADLARPSEEFGGWLDWSGLSPIAQARQYSLSQLRIEQDRLEHERAQLLEEESKAMESIPVIRRRLADVEQQLAALVQR